MKTEPKILIFGKNGQLGYELSRTLENMGDVLSLSSLDCDLCQKEDIIKNLDSYKPNIIVNAAAYTQVDKAESERERSFKINANAPKTMAEWAYKNSALLVHYSTDYVFDGEKDGPYAEDDAPNPLNVYGESKLAGDMNIIESGCDHFIFRVSWIYSDRGNNFYLTMKKLLAERDELKVINDQKGSPASAKSIAEVTALILKKHITNPTNNFGVYNLVNSGVTTWYDFAVAIKEKMKTENKELKLAEIIPIPSSEYPTSTKRPKNSLLSCEKLESAFGIKMKTWDDELRKL